jgi:ATP-dependent Lhr-like helicase
MRWPATGAASSSAIGRRALSFGIGRVSWIGETSGSPDVGFVLDRMLARWGVVFHRLLRRERCGVAWRDLLREARLRELAGTLRGGHFVVGISGEQLALPESVTALRRTPRRG